MKYFVLAGEASGDRQASLLCMSLRQEDVQAVIRGWGGEMMQAQGVTVTKHYRDLAYMGFVEVVKHLPAILKNFSTCKKEILAFAPDALILVDYPGFNLRMATWAAKHHIPVYYYISPQLWAWHTSRVHKIKKAVRKMYVILPFEEDFYRNYGMEVKYIGHPLAMEIQGEGRSDEIRGDQIALLPGSRRHEVERLLPDMMGLARLMPEQQFVIAAVSHLPSLLYQQAIVGLSNVSIQTDAMRDVLRRSKSAVVTSGTATLETALLGVPEVVVYKGSTVSYQIAKRLIKVPYISLVNLIANQKLVPELIQRDCSPASIQIALKHIMKPDQISFIQAGFEKIKTILTSGGGAMAAAKDIISDLNRHK